MLSFNWEHTVEIQYCTDLTWRQVDIDMKQIKDKKISVSEDNQHRSVEICWLDFIGDDYHDRFDVRLNTYQRVDMVRHTLILFHDQAVQ
jgi:hypothetical protein